MSPAEFIDNPAWADFLPESRESAIKRALPTHEDCTPIDVEKTASHLRVGGTLGTMPGYEERPGQIEMTGAITLAYNNREHLMVEAGTGVGKSLAYLIPSIHWAATNDTPVIISTATRNLQSQLIASDIPKALKTLDEDTRSRFKVALLKGRGNYLCLREVGEFFSSGYWTMSKEEQAEMPHFIEFLQMTEDGDLDSYEGLPRAQITCPGEECSGRHCPFYSRCFVYKARKKAAAANLVVVNHALVLAEATSMGGILPAFGRIVFDEAHNLEDIATEYLSYELSMPELTRIINRLRRRFKFKPQTFAALTMAVDEIFEIASLALGREKGALRYKTPPWDKGAMLAAQSRMDAEIARLVTFLHELRDVEENEDAAYQLNSAAESLIAFANEAAFVLKGEKETHAFWIERVRLEKRHAYLRLVGAPLSVAEDLKELFYDVKDSVIFSSATLRVGNDFKYAMKRLGLNERFKTLVAQSPFDYFRQSLVLAPDSLPDPSTHPAEYAFELGQLMRELFKVTNGRALVLFTSYEMMNSVALAARHALEMDGISLYVQGEGVSREAMTRHLKEDERTVVFGAQSFWEGVDIAGEALSCVVLARLPFAQVKDPIVEARSEKIDREGGSSFRDYYLPEAVIKFRQGFGRLIRTKQDRGVVVVTDPRIVTKNYGAVFRKSIPASVHTVPERAELLSRVADFFAC